jgi:hypothetical protein
LTPRGRREKNEGRKRTKEKQDRDTDRHTTNSVFLNIFLCIWPNLPLNSRKEKGSVRYGSRSDKVKDRKMTGTQGDGHLAWPGC